MIEFSDYFERKMMSIIRHDANNRLAEAVIANGFIFLAGQVPLNPQADAKAQTESVLEQVDTLLEKLGSSKNKILEATIYLKDMNDYSLMNEAWDAWCSEEIAPARACVEAKLAVAEWKVEIKLTALA